MEPIRIAAFNWLRDVSLLYEETIPRSVLEKGFTYYNQTIHLIGPQGIFKPSQLELPLSITTSCKGPYDDKLGHDNLLRYSYRGTNQAHPDNVGLRLLMHKQIPLIYFLCIVPGKYLASWPVYIVGDNPEQLYFTVAVDDKNSYNKPQTNLSEGIQIAELNEARRFYLTREVKIRAHQKTFRERVLLAYQNQCAMCRLRHPELLDAAHIIPDSEMEGIPIISNGLSLCKIHHAAFDKNIIGISPDFIIHVRQDILEEIDGPMLKYGLQSLEAKTIVLPHRKADHPDQNRLAERFDQFKKAI